MGFQHNYTGVVSALKTIYSIEGAAGLYKGSMLSMARSIVGSSSNLASYSLLKEYLMVSRGWADTPRVDMTAGLFSGLMSCVFMNPIDVLRTRYYNQPWDKGQGLLYSSGVDALRKIVSNEGWAALYKGFTTHFLRIGPHFCLTFVFLGILRRGLVDAHDEHDLKTSFVEWDRDADGKLSYDEVKAAVGQVVPHSAPISAGLTQRIFARADADRDNFIQPAEFIDMAYELKEIIRESQVTSLFASLASDTGLIGRDEIARALSSVSTPTFSKTSHPVLEPHQKSKLLSTSSSSLNPDDLLSQHQETIITKLLTSASSSNTAPLTIQDFRTSHPFFC